MCDINLFNDVYYSDEYLELYANENEDVFSFEYVENEKVFVNKSIKKKIDKIGNIVVDDGFYDLETAYGYGGFLTNTNDAPFIKKAMMEYENKCLSENVISEFIRFHPFNKFHVDHGQYLDFKVHDRDVVVIDLSHDAMSSYKKKVRSQVRKSLQNIEIIESDNLEKFIELYEATMRKNNAEEFYFFTNQYYQNLIQLKQAALFEVRYEGNVIAMAFFLFGEEIAHYHLSANTDESYKLNSNYALIHALFEASRKMKKKYFMLGGGSTPKSDDPLLKFKKKFSQKMVPFYIGGKIYNNSVYEKYCELWGSQSELKVKYFLKYRLEVK